MKKCGGKPAASSYDRKPMDEMEDLDVDAGYLENVYEYHFFKQHLISVRTMIRIDDSSGVL